MIQSIHAVVESIREGTITPDDAMQVLMPVYVPDFDQAATVASTEAYMSEYMAEEGDFPPELFDFRLCESCHKMLVWDEKTEDFVHLVEAPESCTLAKYDHLSISA
jgi:hypothetical protein